MKGNSKGKGAGKGDSKGGRRPSSHNPAQRCFHMMMNAAKACSEDSSHGWWLRRNPFKRPWGLQADGDLWQMAWKAILCRGLGAQKLTKVKRHSTAEQVEQGEVDAADKEGNDWADYSQRKELLGRLESHATLWHEARH